MELCVTLLDDFKKNTIKELKKKGMVVLDAQGNQVNKVEDLLGDWSKVTKKRSPVADSEFLCKARIWNGGHGAQCSKIKNAEGDYCSQHNNHQEKYGRLIYGRWKGKRYLRYPDDFGRRSKKTIHWKGPDHKSASLKSASSSQTRKTAKKSSRGSSSKRKAAIAIQSRHRGRTVRQKARRTQKKPSPGFFKGIIDNVIGEATKGAKSSSPW